LFRHGIFNQTTKKCDCTPGSHRTSDQCQHCEDGYELDSKDERVRAPRCRFNSCGCFYKKGDSKTCNPIGRCSEENNEVKCICPANFDGPTCNLCASGYEKYPSCVSKCDPPCVHGTCTNNSVCECKGNWAGKTCAECKSFYSGDNCDSSAFKLIGGTVVILCLLGIIAIGIWWFKIKRTSKIYSELGDFEKGVKTTDDTKSVELDQLSENDNFAIGTSEDDEIDLDNTTGQFTTSDGDGDEDSD